MTESDTAAPANGAPRPPSSFIHQALRLAQDHIKLGLLETRFEVAQARRRAVALVFAATAFLTAHVFLQIALVRGLMALGLPMGAATVILAIAYFGVSAYITLIYGQRDKAAGVRFEGSKEELERSKEWIQKRFS